MGFRGGNLILDTGEHAEFGLDGHVVLVRILDNLLGEGDVLLVREGGSIDHHGRETGVHAALAGLEAVTVIEVEADLGIGPAELLGVSDGTLGHVAEKGGVGVVAGALGNLKDDRGLGLGSGLDDGLELLHVVEVESGDGVTAINGLGEHFAGVHKTQFFVRNHSYKDVNRLRSFNHPQI